MTAWHPDDLWKCEICGHQALEAHTYIQHLLDVHPEPGDEFPLAQVLLVMFADTAERKLEALPMRDQR